MGLWDVVGGAAKVAGQFKMNEYKSKVQSMDDYELSKEVKSRSNPDWMKEIAKAELRRRG